ncbi:hypothetical protein BKA69DRAFT_253139 [Paraphysoderma sedebokerense]|nr:hypothetical protein BKA69DRAFT_253139 [Paraphysoderma sedebokerense]
MTSNECVIPTRRLFYVGCTRAKYLLHINYYFKKNYKEDNIFGNANIISDNNDISCALADNLSSDPSNMTGNNPAELLQCLDKKLLGFVQREEPIDTGSELEKIGFSTTPTLTVSALASSFLFQCTRRLHRQIHNRSPSNVTDVSNYLTLTGPSINGLLKTAGLEWEESIVSWLRSKNLLQSNGLKENFPFVGMDAMGTYPGCLCF